MSRVDPLGLWGIILPNIDLSYFVGPGRGFGGGLFVSPDAECGGAYGYTEKGGGFSTGLSITAGAFFGDGVSRFDGDS